MHFNIIPKKKNMITIGSVVKQYLDMSTNNTANTSDQSNSYCGTAH